MRTCDAELLYLSCVCVCERIIPLLIKGDSRCYAKYQASLCVHGVCVCMHTCLRVCVHAHMFVCVCVHAHMFACVCACTRLRACVHAHIFACVCACTHTCLRECTHACMCMYMQVCLSAFDHGVSACSVTTIF